MTTRPPEYWAPKDGRRQFGVNLTMPLAGGRRELLRGYCANPDLLIGGLVLAINAGMIAGTVVTGITQLRDTFRQTVALREQTKARIRGAHLAAIQEAPAVPDELAESDDDAAARLTRPTSPPAPPAPNPEV